MDLPSCLCVTTFPLFDWCPDSSPALHIAALVRFRLGVDSNLQAWHAFASDRMGGPTWLRLFSRFFDHQR